MTEPARRAGPFGTALADLVARVVAHTWTAGLPAGDDASPFGAAAGEAGRHA